MVVAVDQPRKQRRAGYVELLSSLRDRYRRFRTGRRDTPIVADQHGGVRHGFAAVAVD